MESNANEKQLINVSTMLSLCNYQFKNTLHGIICVHNRVSTWDFKLFPPIKNGTGSSLPSISEHYQFIKQRWITCRTSSPTLKIQLCHDCLVSLTNCGIVEDAPSTSNPLKPTCSTLNLARYGALAALKIKKSNDLLSYSSLHKKLLSEWVWIWSLPACIGGFSIGLRGLEPP